MDDQFPVLPATLRAALMIADHFTGQAGANPLVEIDAWTQKGTALSLWVITLVEGAAEPFTYQEHGYWVRDAILNTAELVNIRCHVGYSPETLRFIKLLRYRIGSGFSVCLASGPLHHLLYLDTPIIVRE